MDRNMAYLLFCQFENLEFVSYAEPVTLPLYTHKENLN